MRTLSLSRICIFINIFLSVTNFCYSAELMLNKSDGNLRICTEYAIRIAGLSQTKHRINKLRRESRQNSDMTNQLNDINNQSKEYEDKIESACPGVGFECKIFLSSPEKNNCNPFKILTTDRFILKNNTYQ